MKPSNEIVNILHKHYGFDNVQVKRLNGYENENYLVSSKGERYVLKTYLHSDALFEIVKAERDILLRLNEFDSFLYPSPVTSKTGEFEFLHNTNGRYFIVRMLTFIKGESIYSVEQTNELYESLGKFLALLDLELMKIKNKTIENRNSEWNIVNFDKNKKLLKYITDGDDRMLLQRIFDDFDAVVKPVFSTLRHSIIHNDANDFNVLTNGGLVSGIIDFGDLAYAPLIDELAVAIAYSGFGKENPMKWAKIIIESYNSVLPLEKKELQVLYHMITARLTTTVVNAAYSRITNPQNSYAYISEKDAWKTLKWWLQKGENHMGV